jgi:hypothetical protein
LRLKNARLVALAPIVLLSLAACSPEQIARHLARDGQVATSVDGEGVAEHLESVAFRDQEADRLARSSGARGTCSEAGIFFAESGGDWRAQNPTSSASGGYQFLDSTWAGHGGYARAKDAPPHVQRERFLALWADGAGASHWTESVC